MQTIELKSLVRQGHVRNFSCLRQNVNGYLYITLLGTGGTAQNVYFGRSLSEELRRKYAIEDVHITDEVNINVLQDLVSTVVVQTENADGEVRYKIGRTTHYQSSAAIAAVFGLELDEEVTDFDVEDFMSGFTARAEVQAPVLPATKAARLKKAA